VKDPICAREREQEEIDGRKNEKEREGLSPRSEEEKKGKIGYGVTEPRGERERVRDCDVRGHREGKKRKRWRRMG
jgi:hypothetical protein